MSRPVCPICEIEVSLADPSTYLSAGPVAHLLCYWKDKAEAERKRADDLEQDLKGIRGDNGNLRASLTRRSIEVEFLAMAIKRAVDVMGPRQDGSRAKDALDKGFSILMHADAQPRPDTSKNTTAMAIDHLAAIFEFDPGYRDAWRSTIKRSFWEACCEFEIGGQLMDKVAESGAKRFIDTIIRKSKERDGG